MSAVEHEHSAEPERHETIPWHETGTTPSAASTKAKRRLTAIGVGLSVVLVVLKGFAGIISGSVAVISDALNSLLDVFSYSALYVSVRFQGKPADQTHHYGHHRAEPLAGILIAILAAVLGGIVLRDSIVGLMAPEPVHDTPLAVGIVVFAVLSKAVMSVVYRYVKSARSSPALHAAAVDSRNDALASVVALFGLISGGYWDSIAGLVIGLWILYSGATVGLENIGYLMGKAPGNDTLNVLNGVARDVPGVLGTNNIRAHYVGNYLHAEIHIEVDERISILEAHDIAKEVGERIELLDEVHAAFVHTDPVRLDAFDSTDHQR